MGSTSPNEALGYNNLGFLLLFRGDISGALSNLEHCINLDKTYPRAHYNLGAYHFAQGKDTEGIKEYKKATELDPDELNDHLYDLEVIKKHHPDWTWVDRALTYLTSTFIESAKD
jgi:tetratricopeptide (TPR) repeat protein